MTFWLCREDRRAWVDALTKTKERWTDEPVIAPNGITPARCEHRQTGSMVTSWIHMPVAVNLANAENLRHDAPAGSLLGRG